MKVLKLNKIRKGTYSKRVGEILITIQNCYNGNGWSGTIKKYTHTAKDMMGNNVDMFELIVEPFEQKTKKEVSKMLINYIESFNQINLRSPKPSGSRRLFKT